MAVLAHGFSGIQPRCLDFEEMIVGSFIRPISNYRVSLTSFLSVHATDVITFIALYDRVAVALATRRVLFGYSAYTSTANSFSSDLFIFGDFIDVTF